MSCRELDNKGFDNWDKFVREESKVQHTPEEYQNIVSVLNKLKELFYSKNLQQIEPKRRFEISLILLPSELSKSESLTYRDWKSLKLSYL